MRLFEIILLEYKRDITIQKMGDQLAMAAQRDRKQSAEQVIDTLEKIDPTKNKQYVQWLARQYIKNQFRLEDANRVKGVLDKFERAKSRLQQRDINKYDFRSLDTEMDKIYNVELAADSDDKNVKDVEILYKGPLGQLSVPLTQEASCILGSGTKWCTAAREDNAFRHYNSEGPLYIWKDKNGEKFQFHFPTGQFMDDKDDPISEELFRYFREEHPVIKKLFQKEEKELAKDPRHAFEYATFNLRDRFPEGEPAIARDGTYVGRYIFEVLEGDRFEEYEKLLLTRGYVPDMINYVKHLKERPRIPEIEKAILQSDEPSYALQYVRQILDNRWPEAEKLIASDPDTALSYAARVLDGRFPMGEKAIATKASASYDYARNVLGEPFPEGEEAIAQSPFYASKYALSVIGKPFPEAEDTIAKDPTAWNDYAVGMKVLGYKVD